MMRKRDITHTNACSEEPSRRRAHLYEAAYRVGLTPTQADKWVREQLSPAKPKPEATPSLFGVELVRATLDRQKGQVR